MRQKERLQNWLDYYQLKFERHPDKRPTIKVAIAKSQNAANAKAGIKAKSLVGPIGFSDH